MRPYLAIIKDSFRAAIATKVLYVLLAVITVLLLVLAPLHVKETLDWRLRFDRNVTKTDKLAQRLVENGPNAEDKPTINRVWDRLGSRLQNQLKQMVKEQAEAAESNDPSKTNSLFLQHQRIKGELQDAMNEMIKSRDFYDEGAWSKKRLNSEATEFLDEGVSDLSNERMRRLNRLLMASAFPGMVKRGGGNALDFWYGIWQFENMSLAMAYKEFSNYVLQTVTYFFDKFVLSIGLLIAILVTANMIPETFLPGSLNLLMSKPISRWGLLLAKFVGGCAFVSLCAVYLFVGLWLWLGIQMGIWDKGILLAIPLYILVFAIYYSVSTFVGVYSRSTILSIVVTAIFWAACFAIGLTYQMFDGRINNSRTRDLIAVKDKVLQVGELNAVSTWDETDRQWEKALEIKMMEEQKIAMGMVMFIPGAGDDGDLNTVGPIYDPKHDVVLASVVNLENPATIDHQDLYVADPKSLEFEEVGKMPRSAVAAFSAKDGVLVITQGGRFLRYVGNSASDEAETEDKKQDSEGEAKKDDKKKDNQLSKLAGQFFSGGKKKKKAELFKDVSPDEIVTFVRKRAIAFNSKNQSVSIVRDETISRFDLVDGKYKKGKTIELENSDGAFLVAGGNWIVAALNTGTIQLFDAETLEPGPSFKPQNQSPFSQAVASNDGKHFAFRCRNRTLWILNTDRLDSIKAGDAIKKANVSGQGTITAVSFNDQNQMWYSKRYNRAQLVDLDSMDSVQSRSPKSGWFATIFEYGINPLYWVCPKPGEFYKLVTHLSAAPEDEDVESSVDLRSVSDAKNPWQPLWSGLLFMCGMLFLTCLVFHFRDF